VKQPNWKIPFILSLCLAVFGSFTYWLIYAHNPKEEKIATTAKKPLALPSDDAQVIGFRIKSAKGLIEGKCEDIVQKKCTVNNAANWTITYPQTVKADSENIKMLLSGLAGATAPEVVDLSQETAEKRKQLLDEYGLSDAKRTDLNATFVEFVLEDGKKIAAWFGIQHPLGDKTFVASSTNGAINENTIFLISNSYKSNFDHDLTWFRDKSIFKFDRALIDSFEAHTAGGKIVGVKKDGVWFVNGYKADYEHLETVFSAISQLKAKDFPEQGVVKGLAPVVKYDLKIGKETNSLSLFQKTTVLAKSNAKLKKDGVDEIHAYVKTSARPELLEVDINFRNQIDKKLNDLRDTILMGQTEKATATLGEIVGKKYKSSLTFAYVAGSWIQKGGDPKVDAKRFSSLLDMLASARAKDVVSPAPQGKVTDELTMTVGDEKNPNKFKFRFFQIKDQIYAQDLNNKLNEAFSLPESFKSALPFDEAAWKMK